jgi:hypothetical protein
MGGRIILTVNLPRLLLLRVGANMPARFDGTLGISLRLEQS